MNTIAKPRRFLASISGLLLAASALALPACTQQPPAQPPLAGADIGGPFELVSSSGKTVKWEDFRGKYAIVYFGYAFCPDICPTDMQRTIQGLKVLEKRDAELAAKIQPVFITIDPERDTQDVVGQFASAFSDDLIGLTGSPEAVKAAADNFAVYYNKGEETDEGGYLVDHTNIVYFFDPEGKPLAMLPVDMGANAVADEIEKWAN
ncbi:MAG: SCO family protein [Pseudomonadota bacterium]|nr:SCO family protein [Pseudomonadota bacterium]